MLSGAEKGGAREGPPMQDSTFKSLEYHGFCAHSMRTAVW